MEKEEYMICHLSMTGMMVKPCYGKHCRLWVADEKMCAYMISLQSDLAWQKKYGNKKPNPDSYG